MAMSLDERRARADIAARPADRVGPGTGDLPAALEAKLAPARARRDPRA